MTAVERLDQLPPFTISLEEVEALEKEGKGSVDLPETVRFEDFGVGPEPRNRYYDERIVRVWENNTLYLRFAGDYGIDLDRIRDERDLLNWTLHLCGKTWMTRSHLARFIETVSVIKGIYVHDL
jgi:hypothetical protein